MKVFVRTCFPPVSYWKLRSKTGVDQRSTAITWDVTRCSIAGSWRGSGWDWAVCTPSELPSALAPSSVSLLLSLVSVSFLLLYQSRALFSSFLLLSHPLNQFLFSCRSPSNPLSLANLPLPPSLHVPRPFLPPGCTAVHTLSGWEVRYLRIAILLCYI